MLTVEALIVLAAYFAFISVLLGAAFTLNKQLNEKVDLFNASIQANSFCLYSNYLSQNPGTQLYPEPSFSASSQGTYVTGTGGFEQVRLNCLMK